MSDVGYKKPPAHKRFKKGQSGNPKGRPKNSKNIRNMLRDILNETIPVTENGQSRLMTKREALLRKVVNGAFSLNPAALNRLWHMASEVDDETEARQQAQTQEDMTKADIELLKRFKLFPED